MVHRDYPRNSEKLASYRITNRSCLSSPSPPAAPLIFFKFHIKFKDEDWVEDQNSPVLIGKSDGPVTSASAHVPVGELSFSNLRDSIEQALKRGGVPSVFRHELIVFAWDDVRRNFVHKPIAGGGINGFLVDIEVVVRRRRVTVAPSLSCSICLEDFSGDPKQFLRLPCSHFFHSRCVIGWLKRMRMSCSCPLCRRPL
ncbi:hypothetical protein C2S51_036408 [Perilla frutescens var. frutescens]|nr:hypothetical protein C2S51_036408 [Perilla frutescens var. frutescens]